MGIIAKSAIDRFINRPLRDSSLAKRLSDEQLDAKIARLNPQPVFHTPLRTHQKVCFLLGVKHPAYLLFLEPGLGKALQNDEPVLTPTGFKPIASLQVGDFVIGSEGRRTRVTGVFSQGIKKLCKVVFRDGSYSVCSEDHLWAVNTHVRKGRGHPNKVLPVAEIREDLFCLDGHAKQYIPIVGPVRFRSEGELPIPAYSFGVLLGDGCFAVKAGLSVSLGPGKLSVRKRLQRELPHGHELRLKAAEGGKADWSICGVGGVGGNYVKNALTSFGLMGKRSAGKFIPKLYLHASIKNRWRLLRGLMDTDGYAAAEGTISYNTASPQLRDDVGYLVRSLGGIVKFRSKWVKGTEYHDIQINLPKDARPFNLARKALRFERKRKYFPTRAIISVEDVGKGRCTCISVEAADGLFVTRDFAVTHNTLVSLALFDYARLVARQAKRNRQQVIGSERAIVLVPYGSNLAQWEQQVQEHTPHLTIAQVDGQGEGERWLQVKNPNADLVVITYVGFLALVCQTKGEDQKGWKIDKAKLKQFADQFTFFIGDEFSQLCGRHDALVTRAVTKLAQACQYRYALTGTPYGKDPAALWSQFAAIDGGITLGETLGLFRAALFVEQKHPFTGYPVYEFDKRKKRILNRLLRHNSIRYRADECLDLPEKTYQVLPIAFDEETHVYYDRLVNRIIEAEGDFELLKNTFLNLRQLTCGYLSLKNEAGERSVIRFKQSPKMQSVIDLLKVIGPTRKVVVFHEYKLSGQFFSEMLTANEISHVRLFSGTKNKGEAVNKFLTDPKVRVMLSSSAGALGGNWQAASRLVWLEKPLDPKLLEQEERRVWRMGQRSKVMLWSAVVKGSVDERIERALAEGRELREFLIDSRFVKRLARK